MDISSRRIRQNLCCINIINIQAWWEMLKSHKIIGRDVKWILKAFHDAMHLQIYMNVDVLHFLLKFQCVIFKIQIHSKISFNCRSFLTMIRFAKIFLCYSNITSFGLIFISTIIQFYKFIFGVHLIFLYHSLFGTNLCT